MSSGHLRACPGEVYTFYNWSYGPARDDAARQHPMFCPYAELTEEQKRERDAAWELLGSISSAL